MDSEEKVYSGECKSSTEKKKNFLSKSIVVHMLSVAQSFLSHNLLLTCTKMYNYNIIQFSKIAWTHVYAAVFLMLFAII